jgi:hypothetical protein
LILQHREALRVSEHDRQGVLLQGVAAKPVRVAFDDPTATTNGGALLLGSWIDDCG